VLQNKSVKLRRPFVFFDLGQTLIDEWDFIKKLDDNFLELLNGFGAKIDRRNYLAVRNSVIRDRRIGHGSVRELIVEICNLLAPAGYGEVIARRMEPELRKGRTSLFKISPDAQPALEKLSRMGVEMGLIANQSEDISVILKKSGLDQLFRVIVISSSVGLSKPDHRIFQLALDRATRIAEDCVMVGDRLDTDICPAKTIGMRTIRYTNSLFALQTPTQDCEVPDFSVGRLCEVPEVIGRIILQYRE
jgi:putative hydrolase of the HAD superfamily